MQNRTIQFSLVALVAAGISSLATAQVSHGGQPAGLRTDFTREAPLVSVTAPDVAAYEAEDEAMGYIPLRYGALLDLDVNISDGVWTDLDDGSRAWRIRIGSEGAKSLAIEFDQFHLPAGAEMFVMSNASETYLGAYNIENERADGGFVFEPIVGSELTIEIDVPAGVADPIIDTATLIYDYRDIFGLMDGTVNVHNGPLEGNCLIDVNCPQGDAWELQKRATMRTLSSGALCSGALINNTANDGTNYVLTANHCGQTANTVFRFKYQRAGCNSGSSPTTFSNSGCTVLTSNSTYDNRLLRINGSLPDNREPYYAGWTRATGNTSFAMAMGHPSGGPKKISIDSNGAVMESAFWRVAWSEGTLEGGSSGGPLFDQNGRILGPACCVDNFTCNQKAWFGRFNQFWQSNNIAQWLDPVGTNPTTLDGYDPFAGCPDPVNYCHSFSNSTGVPATFSTVGTASISANDLTLITDGLPTGVPGLYFYGTGQTSTIFGQGLLCVNGTIKRLPVQVTDVIGFALANLDWTAPPFNSGVGAAVSGQTRYFQFWYRDVAGGGAGFNTSDAVEITWCD